MRDYDEDDTDCDGAGKNLPSKIFSIQFIDPNVEEMNKRRSNASSATNSVQNIGPYQHPPPPKPLLQQLQQQHPQVPGTPTSKPTNYETTFDVDGHVETSVTSSNTDLTKGENGQIPRRGPAEGAPAIGALGSNLHIPLFFGYVYR